MITEFTLVAQFFTRLRAPPCEPLKSSWQRHDIAATARTTAAAAAAPFAGMKNFSQSLTVWSMMKIITPYENGKTLLELSVSHLCIN